MMSQRLRIRGDARPNRKRRFVQRGVVYIDPTLRDGSLRSLNRLFRNFYGVRGSHMGKKSSYWRKGTEGKMVKLLTRIANSVSKPQEAT